MFILGLFTFLRMMIRKWSTEIGVTSHRFVEKYGLLSMRTNEIALPNIEGVRVNQSILGRMFGYGTVKIEGTGVDSVTTPAIADPVGFVRAIQTAKEHVAALGVKPLPAIPRDTARGKVTVMRVPLPRALSITHARLMQVHQRLGQRQAQAGAFIAALQPVIDLAEGLAARYPCRPGSCRCRYRPP